jgi:bifunctional UDP-N-acetylglucosamine pyrophosphorylase/glucosamine-1-phosphate N-acetyltransferase
MKAAAITGAGNVPMRIASLEIEETTPAGPEILFQGKSGYFWKQRIFKNPAPYEPVKGTEEKTFDFLLIFHPRRFPAMEPEGVDEFFENLRQGDPREESAVSIEGKPFIAISYGAFQKLHGEHGNESDLFTRLEGSQNIRLIHLNRPHQCLDLKTDRLAIDNAVRAYQVMTLTGGGVTIEDTNNFFIEGGIPIGAGSRIAPGVVIKGNCEIGRDVHIYPHCYIENSRVGDNCTLLPGCVIGDSTLEENVRIGPYAHLRAGSVIKKNAKMGNFVEMKKSTLGEGSKAMHLTYIGDAEVGNTVNIGAGTITCNYDGVRKHKTIIEDGVFIGSGTELVAPVKVGKNSYVGAGSTITMEVPENALAVGRQKQKNIPGWAAAKKRKSTEKPSK